MCAHKSHDPSREKYAEKAGRAVEASSNIVNHLCHNVVARSVSFCDVHPPEESFTLQRSIRKKQEHSHNELQTQAIRVMDQMNCLWAILAGLSAPVSAGDQVCHHAGAGAHQAAVG